MKRKAMLLLLMCALIMTISIPSTGANPILSDEPIFNLLEIYQDNNTVWFTVEWYYSDPAEFDVLDIYMYNPADPIIVGHLSGTIDTNGTSMIVMAKDNHYGLHTMQLTVMYPTDSEYNGFYHKNISFFVHDGIMERERSLNITYVCPVGNLTAIGYSEYDYIPEREYIFEYSTLDDFYWEFNSSEDLLVDIYHYGVIGLGSQLILDPLSSVVIPKNETCTLNATYFGLDDYHTNYTRHTFSIYSQGNKTTREYARYIQFPYFLIFINNIGNDTATINVSRYSNIILNGVSDPLPPEVTYDPDYSPPDWNYTFSDPNQPATPSRVYTYPDNWFQYGLWMYWRMLNNESDTTLYFTYNDPFAFSQYYFNFGIIIGAVGFGLFIVFSGKIHELFVYRKNNSGASNY